MNPIHAITLKLHVHYHSIAIILSVFSSVYKWLAICDMLPCKHIFEESNYDENRSDLF